MPTTTKNLFKIAIIGGILLTLLSFFLCSCSDPTSPEIIFDTPTKITNNTKKQENKQYLTTNISGRTISYYVGEISGK